MAAVDTQDEPSPSSATRGRPRSLQARQAILSAVLDELVEHGLLGMSMDSVASRAGVGKATLYRWWPDKVALTLEALWELPELGEPDTGTLKGDLRALRTALNELMETTVLGDVLPVLIAERRRSDHRDEISRYMSERAEPFTAVVRRAILRGELPATADPELVAAMFSSPLTNSILFQDAALDDEQWSTVIDIIIVGLRHWSSTHGH